MAQQTRGAQEALKKGSRMTSKNKATVKSATSNKANKGTKMSKRTNLSADLIFKTFLTAGLPGVQALTKNHKDPRKLIAKAIETVDMVPGFDSEELRAHLDTLNAKRSGGTRGKKPVTVGDTRTYKVQQNKKTGQLFLIIPVPEDVICVTKGDAVEASFEEGKITIQ